MSAASAKKTARELRPDEDSDEKADGARARPARTRAGPAPRHWRRRLLLMVVGVLLILWVLPIGLAYSPLRNQPLALALPGINGTIVSGSASFGWFAPIVYNNVEVRDTAGNVVLSVAAIRSEKPLVYLATHPRSIGGLRLEQPVANLEVRPDGSNLEDVLAPLLKSDGGSGGGIGMTLQLVDGTIALHDVAADKRASIEQCQTLLRFVPGVPAPVEWSLAGNVVSDGKTSHFSLVYKPGAAATSGAVPEQIEATIEPVSLAAFRCLLARALPEAQLAGQLSGNLHYTVTPGTPDETSLLQGELRIDGLDLAAAAIGPDRLRLNSIATPCRVAWQGRKIDVQQLGIDCDVGSLAVTGQATAPDNIAARSVVEWLHENFSVQGDLDLAKLARLLPATLHIQQGTQITSGDVKLAITSASDDTAVDVGRSASPSNAGADGLAAHPTTHRWTGQIQTGNIAGSANGRAIHWDKPVLCNFAVHDSAGAAPVIDKLDCQSSFVQLTASGAPDQFTADASCDLNQLAAQLQQFVDLSAAQPSGTGKASVRWQRSADGTFQADGNGEVHDFRLALAGQKSWSEPALTVSFNAAGQLQDARLTRLDKASLQVQAGAATSAGGAAAADRLSAVVTPLTAVDAGGAAPAAASEKGIAKLGASWPVEIQVQGDLSRWQARLSPWVSLDKWQLGGACNMTAQATYSDAGLAIDQVHATIDRLHAWGGGWFVDEPRLQLDGSAAWDSAARTLHLGATTLLTSTVSAEAKQATVHLPSTGLAAIDGSLSWQADMARLAAWTHDPRTTPSMAATGRMTGQGTFSESGDTSTAQLTAQIDNLAIYGPASSAARPAAQPAGPTLLYQDKQLTFSAVGKYDRTADALQLDSFELAATALHAKGAGNIAQLSGIQQAELAGTVDYDWQTLSPLLQPYFKNQVQLAGRESRPFSLRGPLAAPLPPDAKNDPLAWLRPLDIQAGTGWTSAAAYGVQIGPGAADVHLADGVLTLKQPLQFTLKRRPVDVRPGVFGSCRRRAIALFDKGPLLHQARITPEMCSQSVPCCRWCRGPREPMASSRSTW